MQFALRNKLAYMILDIDVRDGGSGGGEAIDPQFGQKIYDIYAGKRQHICLTKVTVSPRTEQVSIYPRYISGGVTKGTFIGYTLRPSKIATAISSLLFFSPWRGRVTNNLCSPFGHNSV